jgi:asparagine synthetase B (glutamine-hydrolysing)
MWESDTPRPAPIDGIWANTIQIARDCGASLVLTGDGGDEVLDEFRLLGDLLGSGRLVRWVRGVQEAASWTRRPITRVGLSSIRDALPAGLKQSIRLVVPNSEPARESLMSSDLQQILETKPTRGEPIDFGFPSLTQNLVISYVRSGRLVQILEYEEQRCARGGLDVSHPFLDRAVVEYVAAIPPARRPNDGRTKTLARRAFSGWLPQSVVDRRTATYADGYLDVMIGRLHPHYIERYPRVPLAAQPYIDSDRYADSVSAALTDPPGWDGGRLWSAWTLMVWLDRFDQYDRSKRW